jgi:hypothetical protein
MRSSVILVAFIFLTSVSSGCRALALAQTSGCRVHWVADGFAGYEEFNPAVLLPAGGVIVGGHWQTVSEASD